MEASSPPPPFGLVPAGQPLITAPTSQPSPTSFLYLIPHANPGKPFGHLAVFLLPGVAVGPLPAGTAAAIYVALNPAAFAPDGAGSEAADFRFLGGVGPGKESAVFKLSGIIGGAGTGSGSGNVMQQPEGVLIGINIEDAAVVGEKIQQLQAQQAQTSTTSTTSAATTPATAATALVPAGKTAGGGSLNGDQVVLVAQRIIQNAFNYLSSFGTKVQIGGAAVEVVPLRAFQEWWRKFEDRIKRDPGFLERGQD